MKRKIIRIIIGLIVVIATWIYLVPYFQLILSPFSWKEADINKDGFVSTTETDYYGNYGKKQYIESGKNCTEYFALKDGLPLKKDCK